MLFTQAISNFKAASCGKKLFKIIRKQGFKSPVLFPNYFEELQEMTVNVQKN